MTSLMEALEPKKHREIVTPVAGKIRNFEGDIYGTLDTHEEDYLSTQEGKNLPVKHCICGEDGWALNSEVMQAIAETKAEVHNFCRKGTFFGSMELAQILKETYEDQEVEIELIGLCTDILAMLIKSSTAGSEGKYLILIVMKSAGENCERRRLIEEGKKGRKKGRKAIILQCIRLKKTRFFKGKNSRRMSG